MKLIDEEAVRADARTFDLPHFQYEISQMMKQSKKHIYDNWISKIANICRNVRLLVFIKKSLSHIESNWKKELFSHQNMKKKGTLKLEDEEVLQKLFKCLAIIMEDNLTHICFKSIDAYMDCLMNEKVPRYLSIFSYVPFFNEIFFYLSNDREYP